MKLPETLSHYAFVMEMEVRDYELDCEQIVNNANYLHYMEHTRHKFCIKAGVPFIEMHKAGIDAVARKIEIEYFTPLRSGDVFFSCLNIEKKGPKFIFFQDLLRPDGSPVAKAAVTIVLIKEGKLSRGDELSVLFEPYFVK